MSKLPTPEEQLAFLSKIQRLFAESDFTATYKFALLMSLADLAVERGSDEGGAFELSYREIAQKFVELYWSHVTPYSRAGTNAPPTVLHQNHGRQAAIITQLAAFRADHPSATLATAKSALGYSALLGRVANTVAQQPVRYLQNLGGHEVRFLFEKKVGGIELLPGVVYCLRQFQFLLHQMARQHWIDHIKRNKLNAAVLGDQADLASFLFERSRQSLDVLRSELGELASDQCFYCGSRVGGAAEVDHFIPFSVYSRDLVHNFVFAHAACNRQKSDSLAALPHVERWLEYLEIEDENLQEIALKAGIPADRAASSSVASWIYMQGCRAQAHAWLERREFMAITPSYLELLATAS